MYLKLVLLFLTLSFCFAANIDLSQSDGDLSFRQRSQISDSIAFDNGQIDYGAYLSRDSGRYDASLFLNYENDTNGFVFVKGTKSNIIDIESLQVGVGMMYQLNSNRVEFPYSHKFSYAFIQRNDGRTFVNLRHKFFANVSFVLVSCVVNWNVFGEDYVARLEYNVTDNFGIFYEKNYQRKESQSFSVGYLGAKFHV